MTIVIEFWPAVGFGVALGSLFLIGCHWFVTTIEDMLVTAIERERTRKRWHY